MAAARSRHEEEGADVSASPDKQERLAKVYDAEVVPAYAGRFAAMALRALEARPGARVLEVGCTTGHLTRQLLRRFDADSRITALDETPAFVAVARAGLDAHPEGERRATLEVANLVRLPVEDASADLVISNLALAEATDPPAAVAEAARALVPGGVLIMTAALRGTWAEFLDIYREVLRDNGKLDGVAALDRYVTTLPDGDTVARWLEEVGLREVEITVARWEILFKSSREFFFAPLIDLGPLSRWKHVAGRGDEMQDVFFFTKEAIDTYFKGTPFALSVVGAMVKGRKTFALGRTA
jgi:ubiquinone/menaquinone biosynthesis C-methylase UbiE